MVDRIYSDSATLAEDPSLTAAAHMYNFSRLCILVTTITLCIGTTASPAQSLIRAAPRNVAFNATRVDCFPSFLIGSRQAATRDCLQAIFLLPEGSETRHFHGPDHGHFDQYALPVIRNTGSCMVTVNIHPSFEDYSS